MSATVPFTVALPGPASVSARRDPEGAGAAVYRRSSPSMSSSWKVVAERVVEPEGRHGSGRVVVAVLGRCASERGADWWYRARVSACTGSAGERRVQIGRPPVRGGRRYAGVRASFEL